jgi:hypothetical protein
MLDNKTILIIIGILTIMLLVIVYREQIAQFFSGIGSGLKRASSTYEYSADLSSSGLELDIEEKQKRTEAQVKVLIDGLQKPSNSSSSRSSSRIPAPNCMNGDCGNNDPMKGTEEVFLVSENRFTYEEAEPLCKAYGASLATLEQIQDAYKNGADWCNYGWVKGQMAVYPTQPDTYYSLQENDSERVKNKCGKIGINGGHFPAHRRFGVHCYGPKPATWKEFKAKCSLTKPLTPEELEKKRKAKLHRKQLDNYMIRPFNKQYWAENY